MESPQTDPKKTKLTQTSVKEEDNYEISLFRKVLVGLFIIGYWVFYYWFQEP
jgi:hypothetical protein